MELFYATTSMQHDGIRSIGREELVTITATTIAPLREDDVKVLRKDPTSSTPAQACAAAAT